MKHCCGSAKRRHQERRRLRRRSPAGAFCTAIARTWAHRDRALAAGNETAGRWEAMTPYERWEQSTPTEDAGDEPAHERGQMVDRRPARVASLARSYRGGIDVAGLVSPNAASGLRAVWLLPTFRPNRRARGERAPARDRSGCTACSCCDQAPAEITTRRLSRSTGRRAPRRSSKRWIGASARPSHWAHGLPHVPSGSACCAEINELPGHADHRYYARPWANGDRTRSAFVLVYPSAATTRSSTSLTVRAVSAGPVFGRDHAAR